MNYKHGLYDFLNARVQDKDEPLNQLSLVMTITNNANKDIADTILSLCYHHFYLETGKIPSKNVYGGKINRGGKGIIYNISTIPHKLQRIIYEYLTLNSNTVSAST